MGYNDFLDRADEIRESRAGRDVLDTAAVIPGVNVVSEGAEAALDGQLMQRDILDGHGWAAAEHGVGAAYHGGMSALNAITLGGAGEGVEMVHGLLESVHAGKLGADAADEIENAFTGGVSIVGGARSDVSYGDIAKAHFDHSAINAIPATGHGS
jgi:hypothetical protein